MQPVHGTARLRTLGGLELTGEDEGAIATLLARPKPLALLVYLALSNATGFQRRDALLGLFWPEADTERARSSLRQAVYQVRRALGADTIVTRGDDVGLAEGAVSCDAAEFQYQLDHGNPAAALAIYGGELLPGFFVEGAPAFEHWIGERRRRLRESAFGAARSLSEAAAQRGDVEEAIGWMRRAVALAPDDEPAIRRLIALLERAGDRVAAIQAYELFAQRLRDQYGLQASPETTALVSALREGAGVSSATARSPLDERHVLVTVFANETGEPALDSVGRVAADTIARGLSRLEDVQVVPFTTALAVARDVVDAPVQQRAELVARELGAGIVVSGSYHAAGDDLTIQAWLVDAGSGRALGALGPARAPRLEPLPAVEALAEAACTSLARHLETRVLHVRAAARAPTYEAHAAYIEGLTRFVDGDWRGALVHLDRAVAADAHYTLPLLVSGIAHWNLGNLDASGSAVERAGALIRSAGPFEQALHDMLRAWLAGDWSAAYDAERRQAELAPGSIASFSVAEEARRRNRPREALRILGGLDPTRGEMRGWLFYWVVFAQALHMLGEHRRELDVARQARMLFPESPMALRLEVHALAALGDVAGVQRCIDASLATPARQEPRPGTLMREAAFELRAHGHGDGMATQLLDQAFAWYEELSPEEREQPAIRRATARARYDVGDWAGATVAFAALAGERVEVRDCGAVHHPHLQAHLDHGYLGALAIRRGDLAEAARIEELLERTRSRQLFGSTFYWRAAMAALRGEPAVAVRLLRRAFADGLPYEPFIHADPHFASIRATEAFAALLAPRG